MCATFISEQLVIAVADLDFVKGGKNFLAPPLGNLLPPFQ